MRVIWRSFGCALREIDRRFELAILQRIFGGASETRILNVGTPTQWLGGGGGRRFRLIRLILLRAGADLVGLRRSYRGQRRGDQT